MPKVVRLINLSYWEYPKNEGKIIYEMESFWRKEMITIYFE